jgi:integrase
MGAKIRFDRGVWWVHVHHAGRRWKKRVGSDKKMAAELAQRIQAKLVLGELTEKPKAAAVVAFDGFADRWLRMEVELPIERGLDSHLAPGSAAVYRMQVDVHLRPYFRDRDIQAIDRQAVQAFHDHCVESGRPKSAKSIEMALGVLRLILSHARAQGMVRQNAVEEWKRVRRRGRRRGAAGSKVDASKVLSAAEVGRMLEAARRDAPRHYPLFLFLADTGVRLGEAIALRWKDVNLDGGTARIARSYSSGQRLGPTKTGSERVVDLSSRLHEALAARRPEILTDEALVFPNRSGTFLLDVYFRNKVFFPVVASALGAGRHVTPHCLRHTWASLHIARGTPLKWIQEQGGWTTAKLLLDTYGHYMASENRSYADVLAAPNAPLAHPPLGTISDRVNDSVAASKAYASSKSPRSPIMHFTLPPPFLRNSPTSTLRGRTPRPRTCASRRSETPAGSTSTGSGPGSANELAA